MNDDDFKMFMLTLVGVGFVLGFAVFWLVPMVWRVILPLLHTITA